MAPVLWLYESAKPPPSAAALACGLARELGTKHTSATEDGGSMLVNILPCRVSKQRVNSQQVITSTAGKARLQTAYRVGIPYLDNVLIS